MCPTTRCKCFQIKYENHTNKNTNLHQIYTAPVLKKKKTQAEKLPNISRWIHTVCVWKICQ